MNKTISLLILFTCLMTGCAQTKKTDYLVTIKTPYGDMVAILYDETPKHKENFKKLIEKKYFDSLLFHRVIDGFMIQGGDPDSRRAKPEQSLGKGGPGYNIDAEINPKFFHEKGALSAARMSDFVNPTKSSSGSQFYIVHGKPMSEAEITQLEKNIVYNRKSILLRDLLGLPQFAEVKNQVKEKQQAQDGAWLTSFFEQSDTLIIKVKPDYKPFTFSPEQKKLYTTVGGAPHLDGDYTVFGKVIKGLEVIDKIAAQPKGANDRPLEDIRMIVTGEEVPKKKIEKDYGYLYPETKK